MGGFPSSVINYHQLLGNPRWLSPIFGSEEAMFDAKDKLMRIAINCWFIDDWLKKILNYCSRIFLGLCKIMNYFSIFFINTFNILKGTTS